MDGVIIKGSADELQQTLTVDVIVTGVDSGEE